jgi:hypothetical protein
MALPGAQLGSGRDRAQWVRLALAPLAGARADADPDYKVGPRRPAMYTPVRITAAVSHIN